MKLYIEEGKLKILLDEENTPERHGFLHDTFSFFKRWDTKKNVMVVEFKSHWKYIIKYAKKYKFEIAQDVERYYHETMEEERRKEEREAELRRRDEILKAAESRKKNGCSFCQHLKYEGHLHLCTYAARYCLYKPYELEYEFECRKEAKALNKPVEWFATPYPCNGCEYLKKALEVLEIINLEEQRNGKV